MRSASRAGVGPTLPATAKPGYSTRSPSFARLPERSPEDLDADQPERMPRSGPQVTGARTAGGRISSQIEGLIGRGLLLRCLHVLPHQLAHDESSFATG